MLNSDCSSRKQNKYNEKHNQNHENFYDKPSVRCYGLKVF